VPQSREAAAMTSIAFHIRITLTLQRNADRVCLAEAIPVMATQVCGDPGPSTVAIRLGCDAEV
jgi:hypothetical protein